MSRFFICQDSLCNAEHAYCYTCYKSVCERGEADLHRSIGHEVQPGAGTRRSEINLKDGTDTKYTVRARELAQITGTDGNKLQRARQF